MFRKLPLVLIAVADLKISGRRQPVAPLDLRAVSADTACLRRGATRRSAGNAHTLHVADAFLDDFLATLVRARLTHLALLTHSIGVPPVGAPRLAVPDTPPASRLRSLLAVRCTARRYASRARTNTLARCGRHARASGC